MSAKMLIPNKKYTVVKEFTDYDKIVHPVGEQWIYLEQNFTAYYDGLTIYVSINNKKDAFRLQDLPYEQAELIKTFSDYVQLTE